MELPQIIEALLFAADRPLNPQAIIHLLQETARFAPTSETVAFQKTTLAEVEGALENLRRRFADTGSSLMIQGLAGGYQIKTRPDFALWTNRLFTQPRAPRLSQPALETLAVIAYRQPLGRAEIEAVRGVAVDGVIATLLERKVIRIAGRADQPGRPLLYETTPLFLELFGLKGLDELPNADELRRLQPRENLHAPQQQQFDVDAITPDAPLPEPAGSDRLRHPETSPATE